MISFHIFLWWVDDTYIFNIGFIFFYPDAEKARRAKLAAERRAKVMAQMKAQMNNFISNNATLFQETTTEVIP